MNRGSGRSALVEIELTHSTTVAFDGWMGHESAKQRRRRQLFEQQKLVRRNGTDFTLCPLCMLEFTSEEYQDRMTIEHAPQIFHESPQAQVCLTCKTCNGRSSRLFEAQAGRRKQLRKRGNKSPEYTAVDLSDRLVELKDAYLLTFAMLGYEYILARELNTVREALRGGEDIFPCALCRQRRES